MDNFNIPNSKGLLKSANKEKTEHWRHLEPNDAKIKDDYKLAGAVLSNLSWFD